MKSFISLVIVLFAGLANAAGGDDILDARFMAWMPIRATLNKHVGIFAH